MKTGNAVLAVFFYTLSFFVPSLILLLIEKDITFIGKVINDILFFFPIQLTRMQFLTILFLSCIAIGSLFLVTGREPSTFAMEKKAEKIARKKAKKEAKNECVEEEPAKSEEPYYEPCEKEDDIYSEIEELLN